MSKISELSDGGALQSTDYLIAVRSGGNVKVQPAGMTFSSVTITSSDINGGNIDGTVIGAATPAAGSFTTGQFGTSLNVDGTVTADGLTVDGLIASDSTSNGVRVVKGSAAYYGQLSVDYVSNDVFTYLDSIAGASFNGSIKLRTADNGGSVADRLIISSAGAVFNDSGADSDFRVESDNSTHMLFVDAGNDRVGLDNSAPRVKLDIYGSVMPEAGDAASVEDMLTLYRFGSATVWAGGATLAVGRYNNAANSNPNTRLDFKLKAAGATNTALPETTVMTLQSDGMVNIGTTTDFGGTLNVNGGAVFDDADTLDPDTMGVGRIGIGTIADGGAFSGPGIGWGDTNGETAAVVAVNGILYLGTGDRAAANNMETRLELNNTECVFNNQSFDTDFRVASDNNTHALFVDAGNDAIGINTGDTSYGHVTIVPGGSINSNIVQSPNTTWLLAALRRTQVATAVNSSTFDILRFLKTDGSSLMGTSHSSGSVYIHVQGGSGANQSNYHYSLQHNGLGTTGASFTLLSSSTRGTDPVSSIQVANDGGTGGIKVTLTTINNSGVVNGGKVVVLFDGIVSPT